MGIRIIKEGIFTSLQDGPRLGRQRYGINPGGAMDRAALRLINALLGNDDNAAALEIHFPAGRYLFEEEMEFALGGADLGPFLDGRPIANWRVYRAGAGSELSFEQKIMGSRAYLSVRGGLVRAVQSDGRAGTSEELIGSQAKRAVKDDRFDTPSADRPVSGDHATISAWMLPRYSNAPKVRVIACGEFERLTDESKRVFLESEFTLSGESDRMGARLTGPELKQTVATEIVSAAVTFGTIQLLPNGQLIVLMADHQTSGGYPRIATIITSDLPLAGQLGPGDRISFRVVDSSEAEHETRLFELDIRKLRLAAAFGKYW